MARIAVNSVPEPDFGASTGGHYASLARTLRTASPPRPSLRQGRPACPRRARQTRSAHCEALRGSAGKPISRAALVARTSKWGRTHVHTSCTSRRNMSAPVSPIPLNCFRSRLTELTSRSPATANSLRSPPYRSRTVRGDVGQPGGRAFVVAHVVCAPERLDHGLALRGQYRLRRLQTRREQLRVPPARRSLRRWACWRACTGPEAETAASACRAA